MAFVGRSDVQDPGAQQDQWERLTRRRERLYAGDEQFRNTRPDEQVAAAARAPGLRIAEVMATVLRGYADRPALGQRAREVSTDPATGRCTLRFLPRFETVSYADLWARVQSLAADWHHHRQHPVRAGDFVCVLGFASIDYTAVELACIHLGAVVVPLQTSAPAAQHQPILTETRPRILAVGIDNLDTAVEAALAGTAPDRLVVFDYEPRDDEQRAAYQTARARLTAAGSSLALEMIDDVVAQGMSLPPAPLHTADAGEDPLAFPNAVLALFHVPDKDIRERIFRIYNEHIADVQERSHGRLYGVGLINWWDPRGARRTLSELKSLGLKTFLMPLNPGTDANGDVIDFSSTAMSEVWDAIEEAGLPVTHHIGESQPKCPSEVNSVAVAMMVNIDSFREMFSRYIFGGILDRHPQLRIGWFEGGIAWVPPALQDAEHVLASYRHMLKDHPQHEVRYYWDTHMCASFMVDCLGLQQIDEIGIDKVMWSSDYPYNEGTFGYSERSLAAVGEAVGADDAVRIVGGNVRKFLGI